MGGLKCSLKSRRRRPHLPSLTQSVLSRESCRRRPERGAKVHGIPRRPPMFNRAPSTDARFSYGDFVPFSFDAESLAHPEHLHLPTEFKRRDIYESDRTYFIEALANETFRYASSSRDSRFDSYRRDEPKRRPMYISYWELGTSVSSVHDPSRSSQPRTGRSYSAILAIRRTKRRSPCAMATCPLPSRATLRTLTTSI